MSNTIKITKDDVEASGRVRAEQKALHDLKPIISSMIDSVRGDDELSIEVSITTKGKKAKKDEKSTEKPPVVNNSKTKPAKRDESKAPSGGKAPKGSGDAENSAGSEQEVDPLSQKAPKN